MKASPGPGRERVELFAATALGLLLAIGLWGHAGQDDKYITYWAASAVADFGEILNYNMRRVEQSSSLSFVLILALVRRVSPFSMPVVGYLVSLAGAAGTALLAARLAGRMGLSWRTGVVAAVLTAPSFSYWATSGMEAPWAACAALWFVDELTASAPVRRPAHAIRLALSALLFAAMRPEAPFLLGGLSFASVALALFGGVKRGEALGRAGIALAAVVVVFAFRKLYFDAWWPLPARIKMGGFDAFQGALYLWHTSLEAGAFPLLLFLAGSLVIAIRFSRAGDGNVGALVSLLAWGQLAFIVASGGDWMYCGRFLAPVVPSLVLTGFVAIEAVARGKRARSLLVAAYCVANLGFTLGLLHEGGGEGQPLWSMPGAIERVEAHIGSSPIARVELLNRLHRRDAVVVDELLEVVDAIVAAVPDRRLYLMTGQAGMFAYYVVARHPGRFNVMDLWSLTDAQLLSCFPAGSVEANQFGTIIGVERVLVEHARIKALCGLPLPDVFVNPHIDDRIARQLARLGYEVVYRQDGHLGAPGFFPTNYLAHGIIAVRRELVRKAGLETKPLWRWNLDPP